MHHWSCDALQDEESTFVYHDCFFNFFLDDKASEQKSSVVFQGY
ncbi:hypothetical protein BARBAKC583_0500 [Bartonella bacilliformis KC583]|uniref:Uncharacterized protein n=1 Tax=Bartonella bacilliformis (strain ATCC 35685 / KC583 / Herrer 020/F12,63) TaxID=360095 RepID=A1US62_BARBK|nr:hypothetical protein BARBAKC583_0500 [Bartonella bacilliformis KC583]